MTNVRLLSALLLLAFSAFWNPAGASGSVPCDTSFYNNYQSCVSFGSCSPYSSPAEYVSAHPHCFPAGASASQVTMAGSSFQQISAISGALSSRMVGDGGPAFLASKPQQGLAAGGKNAWNVWGNVMDSSTRQSYKVGANSIRNDMDVTNAVLGVDYAFAPGMVLGVSGAFDHGSGNTQPGAANAWSASTVKGYAIAPYLGYQISKELALDASVGLGSGKTSAAGGMESEGDRLFYAANLSYSQWFKEIQLTGKLGYLHGEEDFGLSKVNGTTVANTAVKNKVDRWLLGLQGAYWVGNGVQPYLGLNYLGDRRSSSAAGTDPVGKGAWQWALGVNFFSLSSGVNGGIAFTQEEGRTNQKNNALTANVGLRF